MSDRSEKQNLTPTPQLRVDVAFRVASRGILSTSVEYPLFAALCRGRATWHGATWLAIHPLGGQAVGSTLVLDGRGSPLRLRVPPDRIPEVLSLSGAQLEVAGTTLTVGTSSLHLLHPAETLAARLVTIKGYTEEEPFAARVRAELAQRGIHGTIEVGRRRIVKVAGDKIVGFGLRVGGLSEADSLALQYAGLGGRQRFGCGILGVATRPPRIA